MLRDQSAAGLDTSGRHALYGDFLTCKMAGTAPLGLMTVIKAAICPSRVYGIRVLLSPIGAGDRFPMMAALALLDLLDRLNLSVTAVLKADPG
jgi:hypothetical protein